MVAQEKFLKRNPHISKATYQKSQNIRVMFFSFPIFVITSIILYGRVFEGQTKKVQTGELLEDGSIRLYTREEIEYHDKNSWFTKLFGAWDKVDYDKVIKERDAKK